MSIVIKRPLTSEQLNQLGKPAQDDINAAASELHQAEMQSFLRQDELNLAYDYLLTDLMTRIAALEDNHDPLPTVQSELDNPS